MTSEDYYSLVGVFVHMGYRKIPHYQLIWKDISHCYDPLFSIVFSRKKFEGFPSFLNLVNEDKDKKLNLRGQIG